MNESVKSYLDAKKARAETVRWNSRMRMTGKPERVKPLPNLPDKPKKYVLEDSGGYVGTEYDPEFAHQYAEKHGCMVTVVDFDA